MTPDQYCQDKAAQSGSSFYYSFLFLPAERRRAITALYAWCREVDDVVDDPQDAGVAHQRLDWWRAELARLFDGKPSHPVTQALQPHLTACGLQAGELGEVLDGMEMDLTQSRYLDEIGLTRYCHCVAGVVGVMSARIFGYTDARTLEFAEKLGQSLQLVNILRDVGEDARRGRIYLPVNTLQRFEVPASEVLKGVYSERFTALMQYHAGRARALYREALELLPRADRRAQRAGLVMGAIYHTLLDEIEASGFQVLHQRIGLTPLRKLWIAWKTWLANR
ncbi:squalene synthase HpnD [Cupriavidus sp. USMAA2-4]|uniref:Squalene synthase HpnD n=1 Tax=Cupriavidus malaysiensis TaxID=367825 RepID=A0A1D9I2W9_9BURK|nr:MULTISPECIES: presqualene diphosphate synthase HpnD [Cupriavidus]AOY90497.1 squalene synthase HpnD [Cupriavidus sp. USMAA2-4]AOY99817.1 squalene synthase HpnD [Cupriavidus sp. USMAHM13]AOZ06444.1 squalene synthase HpnD [Cupriavidus malaysiensis]